MNTNSSFMERYLTPIAVLIGALILALAYVYGHGTVTNNNAGGAPTTVDIKNVDTEGDPFIGDADAPVTVALWFDYQCPFCKQFDTTVLPQLYTDYIKEGKVKVVFKDFQFLGNDSLAGAEFARAVWELYPDDFYTWYEAMFNAQDDEGDQGFGDQDSIVAMTKQQVPDINTDKVVALIKEKKSDYDAAIAADRTEGANLGVNGTPAVIIGTTLLSGAQPYSAVQPLIDAELAK